MDTVFPCTSLDRQHIKWEDYLTSCLTPVEEIGGLLFKREDKFAPLGFSGPNGSKLRQALWLISDYLKSNPKHPGIISGAVTESPQHFMIAAIARHFGIPSVHLMNGTTPEKHKSLVAAAWFGAQFYRHSCGYARSLEHKVFELHNNNFRDYFPLETNITVDPKRNKPERIEAFHKTGAAQAQNIPDNVETLIIPAGSCNSCVSVLYGLYLHPPKNLKRVILLGIGSYGSSDPSYIHKRLGIIEQAVGVKSQTISGLFRHDFKHNRDREINSNGPITLQHYNLNATGFCKYGDLMPFEFEGLAFHPRYEGKCMRYIKQHKDEFKPYLNENTLFWIVGNEPETAAITPLLTDKLGNVTDVRFTYVN